MIYDWSKPAETLEFVKQRILEAVEKEESWYRQARRVHSGFSRTIRGVSIILFTIGAIFPIISKEITNQRNWGYASLAAGGLLLLLDKYLGVSSSYVRFYIAELEIKKQTGEFVDNWELEMAKASSSLNVENIVALLSLVKSLRQAVYSAIQTETTAWATEFTNQTGELYELFKQKQAEYKSTVGNISVVIETPELYTNVEVILDNKIKLPLGRNSSTVLFKDVNIGTHEIKVMGKQNDANVGASKNIDVVAEKTSEVILKLS